MQFHLFRKEAFSQACAATPADLDGLLVRFLAHEDLRVLAGALAGLRSVPADAALVAVTAIAEPWEEIGNVTPAPFAAEQPTMDESFMITLQSR